jgi:Outer membrane protein beta-barrel domain
MKAKIILALMLIPAFSFSQVKSTIDFVSGFEYSYRILKANNEELITNVILGSRSGETGKLNFRFGFNYNQMLSKKFFLKSGIRLASVGYKGEKKTGLVWGSEIDPTLGYQRDPSLPHESQFIYDYWFFEIPIVGRFEFNNRKISPFIEAGISSNIYLTTKTKTATDISSSTNFYNEAKLNLNRFHLSANLSFGINYQLNPKWILFFQPIFRYHFTKLVDAPIKEYLYNYGIELGVRMKIK